MAGFNIRLECLRPAAAAKLSACKAVPVNGDQSFMKPMTDYISAEIGKLDVKFNGVLCLASGEFDKDAGRIIATIQIFGKTL